MLDATFYGQDVLTAAKLNEIIAPQLQKQIQRKPKILVYYGASHGSLVELLKSGNYKTISARFATNKFFLKEIGRIVRFEWNSKNNVWVKQKFKDKYILEKLHKTRKTSALPKNVFESKLTRREFFSSLLKTVKPKKFI